MKFHFLTLVCLVSPAMQMSVYLIIMMNEVGTEAKFYYLSLELLK